MSLILQKETRDLHESSSIIVQILQAPLSEHTAETTILGLSNNGSLFELKLHPTENKPMWVLLVPSTECYFVKE